MQISASLLLAPITLVGLTALSLDIKTKLRLLYIINAICAIKKVPKTLFLTLSQIFSSTKDTCL